MENKAHALAAGIFVALLTCLVLGLAAWLTRDTGERDPYEISTRETVSGLQEQAPVRFRGVDVGKVASIGFDPQAVGNVLIRLEVDRDAPITRSTYATLGYQGVTGLAFIQLADDGASTVRLKPNDHAPPRIPLRPGLLARLEQRGDVILDKVEQATTRIAEMLGDPNQKRVAAALENIAGAAENTNELVATLERTVQQRLDPALAEVAPTLRSVQASARAVERTAAEFGRTASSLNAAGGPVERLAEGAQSLSQAANTFGTATLPRINRTTEDASRTLRQLRRTANALTENPQSLVYGEGAARPGPGESGFQAPGGPR